jgi:hypothetical protein
MQNCAAMMDVAPFARKEEFVINTQNNATVEPNAVPPPVLHNQVVDYEDEEELNSWIWRSQAHINK